MGRVLQPLAMILVTQTLTVNGQVKHAAPCFEFYPQGSKEALSPQGLYDRLTAELDRAAEVATAHATKVAIAKIAFSLKALEPMA